MQKAEIKNAMEQYFERPEIVQKIQQYLSNNEMTYEELDNDALMRILDELQLLNPILSSIDNQVPTEISLHKKKLKLTIQKAKMFYDLQKYSDSNFVINIGFMNQRFKSKLIRCSKQPSVYQTVEMRIDKTNLKLEQLRNIQLCTVVIGEDSNKTVYAIKEIDWRFVLVFGSITFDIQLSSYKNPNVSAGILNIKLDLQPRNKKESLSEKLLNNQFALQKKLKQKVSNQFHQYSTEFWNNYKSIHPTFAKRSIPLYRESEDRIFVFVCKYVYSLQNIRGIDSPFHALRFVSLIPFEEESINSKSLCKRFHTFISLGQGSILDHCHLLCSLLLGFGFNAYICTGYSVNGQHSWVMTLGKQNIVWECLNGSKIPLDSQKGRFYKIINTVYNNSSFYANIQMNEMNGAVTFDLNNQSKWKSIPSQKIQSLFPFNHQISLMYPNINVYSLQEQIQTKLMDQIIAYRKQYKMQTKIDDKLKSMLSIALANYEYQRITQQTFGQKEFQQCIKRYIPEKHTFKAFPIQLLQTNPEKILNILKANKISNQILLTRGDSVFLAVRSKVIVYPDNYVVVWLSLASRYYKLL